MSILEFSSIASAWKTITGDSIKRDELRTITPGFTNPSAIRIKLVQDEEDQFHIRFYGFEKAIEDSGRTDTISMAKRTIQNWLTTLSTSVRIIPSTPNDLNLIIGKERKFTEAAIPVFRRDPKTNKVKRAYKCIGGRKDGRRVSDPDQCLQYPNVAKKMSLSVTRRGKYGQSVKSRTRTKLTNIVAKRVRKANQRMKKARGI